MRFLPITLFFICCAGLVAAQPRYEANWASIDSRPVPTWFEDAKFGIFIHWGLFSVPAFGPTARDSVAVYDRYAEWYWQRLLDSSRTNKTYPIFKKFQNRVYGPTATYQDFANGFKCELFNPTDWAETFKQSGARYVVLTSKHHEGFTLWPSPQAWNWNAVDVGPHRDLAGDLMQAVRAKGLKMGYYYSLYEWFNPLYRQDVAAYVDRHMLPQLKDLVTRYQPDVLWTDGEWVFGLGMPNKTQIKLIITTPRDGNDGDTAWNDCFISDPLPVAERLQHIITDEFKLNGLQLNADQATFEAQRLQFGPDWRQLPSLLRQSLNTLLHDYVSVNSMFNVVANAQKADIDPAYFDDPKEYRAAVRHAIENYLRVEAVLSMLPYTISDENVFPKGETVADNWLARVVAETLADHYFWIVIPRHPDDGQRPVNYID